MRYHPEDIEIPPCCEECPEDMHTNCPGKKICLRFLKFLRRETFYNEDTDPYKDMFKEFLL